MIKNMPLIAIAIGLILLLAAFVAGNANKSDFYAAEEVIVMRNIAHQILRYTGDSTSPIAPVVRLSAGEFQIPFESSFSFKPDSVVSIIDRVIAANKLPSKYIINVRERKTDKVIYGYAVLGPEQKSIVPCRGRDQPAKPYYIDIKFEENRPYAAKGLYAGGISLLGMGLVMFVVNGYKKRRYISKAKESDTVASEKTTIPIGRYLFFADEQLLKFNEEETILTVKESKILSIFANAPNQIIDRKRLQKEIWEDEGVIVGRSLDMFISRLRKKLENDPEIKLVNIHSKGYKLEIGNKSS
jgi:hypothetical protein